MSQLGKWEIAAHVTSTSNSARYGTKALTQQIKLNSCHKASDSKTGRRNYFCGVSLNKLCFRRHLEKHQMYAEK